MKLDIAVGYSLALIQAQGEIQRSLLQERIKQCFDGLCQTVLNEALLSLLCVDDLSFRNQKLTIGPGGVVHTRLSGAVTDGFVIGWLHHLLQHRHVVVATPQFRQPAQQLFQGGEIAVEVYLAVARLSRRRIVDGYVRGQDPEQYYVSMLAKPVSVSLWPLE